MHIIQSIAPYFLDFELIPNEGSFIRLQWKDKYSDMVYGVTDLSDGTIRFIALTVLFLHPNLPNTIIIDEPELGLHPTAIGKLSGMIQSASKKGSQVIIATQSSDLISYFSHEDIIAVDQIDGCSKFKRLNVLMMILKDGYNVILLLFTLNFFIKMTKKTEKIFTRTYAKVLIGAAILTLILVYFLIPFFS